MIKQRMANPNSADHMYLLVDRSLAPLMGTLEAWPSTITTVAGWTEFRIPQLSNGTGSR